MPIEPLVSVLQLQPGQEGVLRRVDSSDARVLRYLGQLALMPGCKLKLVNAAPFNGPVTLEASDDTMQTATTQILGKELADKLFVLRMN